MEIVGFWSNIIKGAKECGRLRKEGKFKEADKLQKAQESIIKKMDRIVLDCEKDVDDG